MRKIRIGQLSLVFLWITHSLSGQSADSSRFSHSFFPVAYYLPETSLALGALGIFSFRFKGESPTSRTSQFLYSGAYTLKNQMLLYFPFEIYRNENRTRIKGELGYYKYFYNFYGIGHQSQKNHLETYDVNFPRIDINISRMILPNFSVGIGSKFDEFNITRIDEGGLLDSERYIGYEGGRKLNLLLTLFWDSRDHPFSSISGYYFETFFQRSVRLLGSDFSYNRLDTDLRYFHPVARKSVIALQLYTAWASKDAPFFDLPYLSNPRLGRGYSDRRFIGHRFINFQMEWRYPIKGRFNGVVFLSSSKIAAQSEEFGLAPLRWSYGLGLRFLLNPQELTKLRLDIGRGEKDFNFYFTVNEAF